MSKKIAVCVDSEPFLDNKIFNPEIAKKYPGAESMSVLERVVDNENGYTIATGDIALEKVRLRKWSAEDVLVVQDMDSRYGMVWNCLGLGQMRES